MLNPEHETFIIHIALLSDTSSNFTLLDVHPFYRPQIANLIAKKAFIKVSTKYLNFIDIFSLDLGSKLPKHTGINDHAIELVDGQQPLYGPIYSLKPVELENLKTYIKTNLANRFIRPSKSPAGILIFFDWKSNGSLWLYIDYRGLNNLIIKNQYLLPLIGMSLDRVKKARRFT